jgi:DNA-binding NarL/FixJ family response regulator
MASEKISILLVDDHKILRDGLRSLLESEDGMAVVGEADTGKQAIQLAIEYEPDVIIMDLRLPDMNGLDAVRAIRRQNSKSRIIVLSMYSHQEVVMQAIEAGCVGYVPKSAAHTSLTQAIQTVMKGERFLHSTAATALVESITTKEPLIQKFNLLSNREQEVLRLTAMGFTGHEIAEKLNVSSKTVDTYRQRIMEKLEFQHRSELVQFALQAGLLDNHEWPNKGTTS